MKLTRVMRQKNGLPVGGSPSRYVDANYVLTICGINVP